jgi:hypothetical protein
MKIVVIGGTGRIGSVSGRGSLTKVTAFAVR